MGAGARHCSTEERLVRHSCGGVGLGLPLPQPRSSRCCSAASSEVKLQLLQLQARDSAFADLGVPHASVFTSCAARGAAARCPAPRRLPGHLPGLPRSRSSGHQTTGCGSQRGDYGSFTSSHPDTKEFNPAFEIKSVYLPSSSESVLKHLLLSHRSGARSLRRSVPPWTFDLPLREGKSLRPRASRCPQDDPA